MAFRILSLMSSHLMCAGSNDSAGPESHPRSYNDRDTADMNFQLGDDGSNADNTNTQPQGQNWDAVAVGDRVSEQSGTAAHKANVSYDPRADMGTSAGTW
jgi:hypothetical protein